MAKFNEPIPKSKALWSKAWLLSVIFIALCALVGTAAAVTSTVKLTSVTLDGEDTNGVTWNTGASSTNLADPLAQVGVKDENGVFLNQPFYGGTPLSGGSLGEVFIPLEYGTHTYTLLADVIWPTVPCFGVSLFFDDVRTPPQIAVYNSNGGTGDFSIQPKDTDIIGSANGGLFFDKAPGKSVYVAPDGTKVEVVSFVVDAKSGSTNEVSWGEIGPSEQPDTVAKLTLKVTPPPAPIADFSATPTSGFAPLQVTFTDASTGGVPASYKWNFGDGTSSYEKNPTHYFNRPGKYNIGLTVQNSAGSSTLTRNSYIIVDPTPRVPTAAFSSTSNYGAVPLTVAFTDYSSGNPNYWLWDFGDGVTASAKNPVHTFNSAGTYDIKLTAKNSAGSNVKTIAKYVTVISAS